MIGKERIAYGTVALERNPAEQALRTSESTLRSFYESAPLMMGVVEVLADNSDIIHIYDNPATDQFFGRPRGATVGQSALGMGAPQEVVGRWIEHYRLAEQEGRPVQFEYSHPRETGAVWLSAAVARIGPGDSGRTRFSYAVADVTERKQVEEALQASEERLTLATLGGDLGVWDWDIARDKACLSGKYYEITGYQEGEVQPNLEFFQGLVHPEDLATVESTMTAHLRGENDYSIIEYRLRRKTGEHRWIRGVGKVVGRDAQGAPLRMAGVIADITAQKQAQAAFTRELILSQETERKRIALDLHDGLGQALLILKNRLGLLARSSKHSPEVATELDKLTKTAAQAIGDVRTICQALRPVALEQIGMTKAIEWMIEQVSEASPSGFSTEIEDIDGLLAPDLEMNLYRIVQEALNNVTKHAHATEVIVRMKREPWGIALSIIDNGCGFVSPGPRVMHSDGRKPSLGLASIAERAKLLNGELKIQSGHGTGTRLTLTIPLIPGPSPLGKHPSHSASSHQ